MSNVKESTQISSTQPQLTAFEAMQRIGEVTLKQAENFLATSVECHLRITIGSSQIEVTDTNPQMYTVGGYDLVAKSNGEGAGGVIVKLPPFTQDDNIEVAAGHEKDLSLPKAKAEGF